MLASGLARDKSLAGSDERATAMTLRDRRDSHSTTLELAPLLPGRALRHRQRQVPRLLLNTPRRGDQRDRAAHLCQLRAGHDKGCASRRLPPPPCEIRMQCDQPCAIEV